MVSLAQLKQLPTRNSICIHFQRARWCKQHVPLCNRRSGLHQFGNHFLAHERLAIMDPASGDQPLFNEDKSIIVTVNGEIYNYEVTSQQAIPSAEPSSSGTAPANAA